MLQSLFFAKRKLLMERKGTCVFPFAHCPSKRTHTQRSAQLRVLSFCTIHFLDIVASSCYSLRTTLVVRLIFSFGICSLLLSCTRTDRQAVSVCESVFARGSVPKCGRDANLPKTPLSSRNLFGGHTAPSAQVRDRQTERIKINKHIGLTIHRLRVDVYMCVCV